MWGSTTIIPRQSLAEGQLPPDVISCHLRVDPLRGSSRFIGRRPHVSRRLSAAHYAGLIILTVCDGRHHHRRVAARGQPMIIFCYKILKNRFCLLCLPM